jgi:type IV pilus assembly protein PilE
MKNRFIKGFTLIELMIVVAIVAIIASIALPSYQESVRKTRRGAAKACLNEVSQQMERFFTSNLRYTNADGSAPAQPVNLPCVNELNNGGNGFYTVAIRANPAITASSYALEAVPIGGQVADRCGTLILDHRNRKSTLNATESNADVECWK